MAIATKALGNINGVRAQLLKISNPRILTKVGLAKVESGTAGTILACAPCIYPGRRRLRSGTAWQRSLEPTPVVRSVGDLRICGRYTIPDAIRGRAAQELAHRPIWSHARSVLNSVRTNCPVAVHRLRVRHRAPSWSVHDSGRNTQPGGPEKRTSPTRIRL